MKLPRQMPRRVEPLTAEQVALLADGIEDRYRPLVILGAGAGLRIGEALGLTRGKIDFLRRSLSVTQQAVTVKRVTTLSAPKTPASMRTVPLGDAVLADLAAWFERNPRAPDELLVTDVTGAPIPQNRFSQTWARTVKRVGLPAGTRHHDLRHTFASALISAGCSVKAVQMALGHDSATTTLNLYAHLWPSDADRTRAAIDAFLTSDQEERNEHAV
ncbi:MAG TPA: site-specific integrase [Acidimicrobiales bacterium]